MHGNDILDAVLAQYSVYFRSKRWTMQLASWVIDVAVACGFINANYFGIPRSSDCLHAAWIEKLIDGLIEKTGIQNLNSEINSNNFVYVVVLALLENLPLGELIAIQEWRKKRFYLLDLSIRQIDPGG